MLLVRHGRTAWNAEGRFLGRTDIPLDDEGEAQAARFGAAIALSFDRVVSSPLSRAFQTARAIHREPDVHDGLMELNQGVLEGLLGPEAFERYPTFFADWQRDPGSAQVPNGERLDACQTRAVSALDEIVRSAQPGQRLAVFTHQMVIASVCCHIEPMPIGRWRERRVGNVHGAWLSWHRGAWSVHAHNWHPASGQE